MASTPTVATFHGRPYVVAIGSTTTTDVAAASIAIQQQRGTILPTTIKSCLVVWAASTIANEHAACSNDATIAVADCSSGQLRAKSAAAATTTIATELATQLLIKINVLFDVP